jgi:hypothetical protein
MLTLVDAVPLMTFITTFLSVPVLFISVVVTISFLFPVPLIELTLTQEGLAGEKETFQDPVVSIVRESDEFTSPLNDKVETFVFTESGTFGVTGLGAGGLSDGF